MKTLYYEIMFRDVGYIYNEGFVIIKIDDEEKISIEGVLTRDFIEATEENDTITFNYYETSDNFNNVLEKMLTIQIPKRVFQLPIRIEGKIQSNRQLIIDIDNKICDMKTQVKYSQIITEFKENNVFKEERL